MVEKKLIFAVLILNIFIKTLTGGFFKETMSHTLLLVQPNRKLESRTYGDFESLDEALEGVCKIYEEHLKRENPHHASITYDISQVG